MIVSDAREAASPANPGKPRSALSLSLVLKVLFGAAIVAWMAFSGKLNFAQIARSFAHWPLMLAIAGLGYCQIVLMVWRWRLLLHALNVPLPFRQGWGLTMIGMLFNVVVPGAVGGDLIKGYYITRATPGRQAHAATSIVMDRVAGLIGLFLLGAIMIFANPAETLRNPATRSLGALTLGGLFAGLASLYAALFAGNRLSRWSLLPGVARNIFSALHEYRQKASVVPIALAVSTINQSITCAMVYLALRSTGVAGIPVGQFFLVVPLGLLTTAVPISPAGVGVGQAAFFALFQSVAPAYASAGTAAFTVYQVIFILICLSGLFWYIRYQHMNLTASAGKPAGGGGHPAHPSQEKF